MLQHVISSHTLSFHRLLLASEICHLCILLISFFQVLIQHSLKPPSWIGPSTADNKSHVRNVLTSLGY